ncbi:MAG: cation:proton antiporter [Magnetococcales bacterium]|nr:cation:proton antiporter [Magnetococcales bacterium]
MSDILSIILPTLAIAIVLNLFFRRLDLPTLIGYITAGAIATALFHLDPASNPLLHEIAEMGIVFLMFTIGLEFSIAHLMTMRNEALLYGGSQVFITGLVFGSIAGVWYGMDLRTAIVIGAGLALSSTAIVLQFLNENREIDKPYGRTCLGILLFQDLAVIPILLMIRFFTDASQSVPILLLKTAGGAMLSFLVLYLTGKYLIARFLAWVSDAKSHETFVGSILLIVISAAWLTHALGLSYSLGAFFAGLMIAETKYRYQIESDLIPFRDLLLGVFFVTVGMQIELTFLLDHWQQVLLLTGGLILLKGLLIAILVRLAKPLDVAFKTGLALAQGGGFSFAVFATASNSGLLDPDTNQLLIIIVAVSMALTPFILKNLERLALLVQKEPEDQRPWPVGEPSVESNRLVVCGAEVCTTVELEHSHIVVCGYGQLGRNVMKQLGELEYPCVAIEHHRQTVQEGIDRGDAVIFGNAAQQTILEKAHVRDAGAVIIALEDERAIRLVSEAIADVAEEPLIVVRIAGELERDLFKEIPIKSFVEERREVARILIDHALTCEMVRPYAPKVCRECEPEELATPFEQRRLAHPIIEISSAPPLTSANGPEK